MMGECSSSERAVAHCTARSDPEFESGSERPRNEEYGGWGNSFQQSR